MPTELPRHPRHGAEGVQPFTLRELCACCPLWADVTVDGAPLCNGHARLGTAELIDGLAETDWPHVEAQLFPWADDIERRR